MDARSQILGSIRNALKRGPLGEATPQLRCDHE